VELAGRINIWLSVVFAPKFISAPIDYVKCVFRPATVATIFGSFLCVSGVVGLIHVHVEDLAVFISRTIPSLSTSLTHFLRGGFIIHLLHDVEVGLASTCGFINMEQSERKQKRQSFLSGEKFLEEIEICWRAAHGKLRGPSRK
jgi:hypothetical protein